MELAKGLYMYYQVVRVLVHGRSLPKVFNREELQYGTYEMGVWDYWWGDKGRGSASMPAVFMRTAIPFA